MTMNGMSFFMGCLLIVALLFLYIRYIEKTAVFYPDRNIEQDPSLIGLTFEDISIYTPDDEILHGWWVEHKNPLKTVLFFHGNAGNISHRLEKLAFFHQMGLNVLLVDYRGFGQSTGSPSEKGLYIDAQAAYHFLRKEKNISIEELIVYGASLGGAIAIDLASKEQLAGLIVDSTFTSAADMARLMFPWAPTGFLSLKFNSITKIKNITIPKLIFHSTDDETVPFSVGQKLSEAAAEPKKFVTTVGGHNDEHVLSRELFEQHIKSFIDSLSSN